MKTLFRSINSDFEVLPYDIKNEPVKEYVLLQPYAKDKNGKILNDSKYFKVVESGSSFDFQAKIESYRDEVEIYSIIKRMIATGDNSVLMKSNGFYGDVREIDDKGFLELHNQVNKNYKLINNEIKRMSEAEASTDQQKATSSEASADNINSEVKTNE